MKIGHFKMSIFKNPGGLLFFPFFVHFHQSGVASFCEHYAVMTEYVIYSYAAKRNWTQQFFPRRKILILFYRMDINEK